MRERMDKRVGVDQKTEYIKDPLFWPLMDVPKDRSLMHPSVLIDVPFMRKAVKNVGARRAETREFMHKYKEIRSICKGDDLLNRFLWLQRIYELVIAETIPHLAAHGCRKYFTIAISFFTFFNQIRRLLFIGNNALRQHFPRLLLLTVSAAPRPASHTPPPPPVDFSTLLEHLDNVHVVITSLKENITNACCRIVYNN